MESFCLKKLFLVLLTWMVAIGAYAQQYQSSFTPSSNNSIPLASSSNKIQWLYLPSEITPAAVAGPITKIYLRVGATAAAATFTNLTIKMGTTTQTASTATFVTGMQLCYTAATTSFPAQNQGDWLEIPLQNYFIWDGTSSLVLEVSQEGYTVGRGMYQYSGNGNRRTYGTVGAISGSTSSGQAHIGFDMIPCTVPPVAGNATVDIPYVCAANTTVTLNLTGNSVGVGQTYEWEVSTTNTPFNWVSVGAATGVSSRTTTVSAAAWYRCKVTCGSQSDYSSVVAVSYGTPLPGGTYTINPSGSGPNNFPTLEGFVDVLNSCGIAGPVTANVSPALVTANRIQFNDISGASAANRIRINGNGSVITYAGTSTLMSTVELNGTKYLTLDSFNIISANASYGWGIHLWNAAQYDSITRCRVDLSAVNSSSSTSANGIILGASRTSVTTYANNASDCYFGNNEIIGYSASGYGVYYGISQLGSAATHNVNNIYDGNTIRNFYYTAIYLRFGNNVRVINNDIQRETKNAVNGTAYGIYSLSANANLEISGNRIHHLHGTNNSITSASYPIYISSPSTTVSAPLKIINNAIYQNNLPIIGIYLSVCPYAYVYHNTIESSLPATYTTTSSEYGIYLTSTSTGSEVKNNIVHLPNSPAPQAFGISIGSAIAANGLQGNSVSLSPSLSSVAYGYLNNNYATLAAFRSAFPAMETTSISVNPYFTNPGAGNLLPSNNMLYRKGVNLGGQVNNDITAAARFASQPTPGCYELASIPATPGVELVSILVKDLLCASSDSLKIVIANQSAVTLTSVRVNWYLNGTPQTALNYTGNIPPSAFDTIFVGMVNMLPNQATQVAVRVTQPNNQPNSFTGTDSLSVLQGTGMSGVYTVNAASATSGTNFNNISDMLDALNVRGLCGPVVINFVNGSGPYTGDIILKDIRGLSAVNTLTLNGNGNQVEYNGTVAKPQAFVMDNVSYVSVKNFIFKSLNTSYGWGALISNNCQSDSIQDCTFDMTSITGTGSNNGNGIVVSGSYASATTSTTNTSGLVIQNNIVMGNTPNQYGIYYGISLANASNSIVRNNNVQDFYYYGIYVTSGSNNQIMYNTIHKSNKTSATNSAAMGIYLSGSMPGARVVSNRIYRLGGQNGSGTNILYPYYLASASGSAANPVIIANNLVYGNKSNGTLYGAYVSSSSYVRHYHNTIVLDENSTSNAATYGYYFTSTGTQSEFKNNIIAITGGTTGSIYGYYMNTATSIPYANAQRNNVYISTSQSANTFHSYWGADRATLAALQTAYPTAETGSLSVDPQFINLPYGNFTLQNVSPLMTNGENLTALVPEDINGVNRTLTPTVGAYEVTAPLANDAKTLELVGSLCRGTHNVTVKIANNGSNVLDSVRINWTINGVAQPTMYYTTPIVTQVMSNTLYIHDVNLGPATISGPVTVKVWTSHPNGQNDALTSNDTIEAYQNPPLAGIVTINSGQPAGGTNYQSFGALTADLDTSGLCGPLVVNVVSGSGPYDELVTFSNYTGSGPVNTITVNGNGNTVQFAPTTARYPIVHFNGAQYIKLDNLVIKSLSTAYGWGVLFNNGSLYDSLTNCVVDLSIMTSTTSNNSNGIVFSNSLTSPTTTGTNLAKNIYVGSNELRGNPGSIYSMYSGVCINSGADSITIHNNEIKNFWTYGIYFTGNSYNTDVNGNRIHRSDKTSVSTFYGISTASAMSGSRIRNNRIYSPTGGSTVAFTYYGMSLAGDGTAANPVQVYNNLVYDINGGGSYAMYFSSAQYNQVYHNTVSYDRPISYGTTNYGMYFAGTNTGTEVKNNIINFQGGGTTTKYGYYFSSASPAVADIQRNNIYFNTSQAGTQYHSYYGGARATLAALQAAYPTAEVGTVITNPYFTNPAAGNFRPGVMAFPMLTNGLNLNAVAPVDVENTTRPAAPNPGAWQMEEFVNNNAGADTLQAPAAFCAGSTPVIVTIKNEGLNDITSVQVHWSLNGVLQTPVTYTGTLTSPLVNYTNSKAAVALGNAVMQNGFNTVKWWTVLPNNSVDIRNSNDTAEKVIRSGFEGTFTIDQTQAASATNFTSVSSFVQTLEQMGVCGPVVADIVTGTGPYAERVYIGTIPGTSAANTVRINGNGNTVQHNSTTSESHLLRLTGTQYTTINNVVFKSINANYGWGAHIMGGAAYDSIINCVFDLTTPTSTSSAYCNGITFSGSLTSPTTTAASIANNCYIGNNRVLGTSGNNGHYYAMTLMQGTQNVIVEGNEFANFYIYGIYLGAGLNNIKISNNTIHRSAKTAVTTFYGIYSTGLKSGRTEVTGNRIHTPGGVNNGSGTAYGMYFTSASTTANDTLLITNNVVYNMNQAGSVYGVGVATGGQNVYMLHNTIDFPIALTGTTYGFYISSTHTNGHLKNNIVSLPASGTGTMYGYYIATTNGIPQANVQRNNIWRGSAAPPASFYHSYHGGNRQTLANLTAAYPAMEVGSISVDPQYVNAATGNLAPLNNALYGNGLPMQDFVPADITGLPRPVNPTPGAYEKPLSNGNDGYLVDIRGLETPFCPGTRDVEVVLMNYGSNPLSNFNINWSINGVPQTPYLYSGVLDTFRGAGRNTDTVLLGTGNFTTGSHIVKAWVNVNADVNRDNDTATVNVTLEDYKVVAVKDTVCKGAEAKLKLNPVTGLSAGMLEWYSSPDGITYTPLPASAAFNYNVTVMDPAYFKVAMTIDNMTCYTDSLRIDVVDPQVLSVNAPVQCGPGSTVLTAVTNPLVNVNWYEDENDNTPLFTGGTFVTPVVSRVDTFWAEGFFDNGTGDADSLAIPLATGTTSGVNYHMFLMSAQAEDVDINSIAIKCNAAVNTLTSWDIYYRPDNYQLVPGSNTNGAGWTLLSSVTNVPSLGAAAYTVIADNLGLTIPAGQTYSFHLAPPNGPHQYATTAAGTITASNADLVFRAGHRGGTTPFNCTTASGMPIIKVNYAKGEPCVSPRVPVIVTVHPEPEVDLGPDINTCVDVGHLEFLNARNPGSDYIWDNSYNGQVRVVDGSGTYFVTVTNTYGCVGSDTININFKYNPEVDLGNDTLVCNNVSVKLDAGSAGISYIWNTGATTRTINTGAMGLYYVNVMGENGCVGTDTVAIRFGGVSPTHDGVWVRNVGINKFSFAVINPVNIHTYIWDFGDGSPVSYLENPTHYYPLKGNYVVTLRQLNECGNAVDTTTIHVLTSTGIDELETSLDIALYPNPAKDRVEFRLDKGIVVEKVYVYNMLGQLVHSQEYKPAETPAIDVAVLGAAMYNVQIHTNKGVATRKLDIIK